MLIMLIMFSRITETLGITIKHNFYLPTELHVYLDDHLCYCILYVPFLFDGKQNIRNIRLSRYKNV